MIIAAALLACGGGAMSATPKAAPTATVIPTATPTAAQISLSLSVAAGEQYVEVQRPFFGVVGYFQQTSDHLAEVGPATDLGRKCVGFYPDTQVYSTARVIHQSGHYYAMKLGDADCD